MLFFGCTINEDEPEPQPHPSVDPAAIKRVIVVYAVNRSSLYNDFLDDSTEMLAAVSSLENDDSILLLYRTDSATSCGLYYAGQDSDGQYGFMQLKSYERDKPSTHPDRISEVLNDALAMYENASYDLVLWGHGMSWKPYFTDHTLKDNPAKAYGGEYNSSGTSTDWTEIDELAAAIPSNRFDTIWFDCCYMSGIETIYEFRDKCKNFVAYPTEVWSEGCSYYDALPYLMQENPDVAGAAEAFYHAYAILSSPATITLFDMSKLEAVAETSRKIMTSGELRAPSAGLLNYSRTRSVPLYDFRQYYEETAKLNGREDLADELCAVIADAVVYQAASDKNFDYQYWNTENICGINVHRYTGEPTSDEEFYETLAWYRRVYL